MRYSSYAVVVAVMSQSVGSVLPAESPEVKAQLNLLVYDFTRADAAMLRQAETGVGRILAKAGVRTVWHHCKVSPDPPDPGCEEALGPMSVALRILPGRMARRIPRSANELGFVAQPLESEFALHAMIFFDRVEDLASRGACPRHVLLSHAMAHEIGHALLGVGSHSRAGIMKPNWGYWDLNGAAQGQLRFTAEQSGRMRVQLQRRAAAQRKAAR